jgi:hypothetical protein
MVWLSTIDLIIEFFSFKYISITIQKHFGRPCEIFWLPHDYGDQKLFQSP